MRSKTWILRVTTSFFLAAAIFTSPGHAAEPPAVQREFRGLWVATVDDIDWPSTNNLTTKQQKAELLGLLDKAVRLHLNVIVLQVRPACDAFYKSKIEPWSEYLTGRMGRAPHPYYDPLAFAVKEAHKRGLELHAWLNPYRARFRELKTPISPRHVSVTHPELVRAYGKFLWLDPTEQATRDYSLDVIMDVVRRYDIDGIHFDDYFYPYPEKAKGEKSKELDFPDDASWARYQAAGGKLARNDWRRENVNLFVQAVYQSIKKEKPWVKFGISPFGIWQPKSPEGIKGFNAFDTLFCDSRKWLAEGWVDYFVPQLYWPIAQKAQSFSTLLHWWQEQNLQHRVLCPGMRISGWKDVDDDAREASDEILLTRKLPDGSGQVLWHSKPLFGKHADVAEALRKGVYAQPALAPAYPWLNQTAPARPSLKVRASRSKVKLYWKDKSRGVWQWVVQIQTAGQWTTQILPGGQRKEIIPMVDGKPAPEAVAVSAVDRCGNLSEAALETRDPAK